jgi:hypothetical protein
MAGQPIKKAMVSFLVAEARRLRLDRDFPEDAPPSRDELAMACVVDWMCGGSARKGQSPSLLALSRICGVSPAVIYKWVHDPRHSERGLALGRARETSAHFLVDQGMEILDAATPQDASLSNNRAAYRRWLAGIFNRPVYGDARPVSGTAISIGQLHLHAHEAIRLLPPAAQVAVSSAGEEAAQIEEAVG